MHGFILCLGIVAFIVAFAWAGHSDYQDALQAAILYCDNVEAGIWPDFDKSYQYCESNRAQALLFSTRGD